jgi:hypothetical protein
MRILQVIDYLQAAGPSTIDDITSALRITEDQFRTSRYSLPGMMAMEDRNVVIPRPVAGEGYIYKLAASYQTGGVDTDGKPNLQGSSSDVLTRLATVYVEVEGLVAQVPGRSAYRKLLRKLQKALDNTIDRAEDLIHEVDGPISDKAQYVLDRIA